MGKQKKTARDDRREGNDWPQVPAGQEKVGSDKTRDEIDFADRHRRVRERMEEESLDAVIAFSNAKTQGCVQYLTNYSLRFVSTNTLPDGTYRSAGSCAALFPLNGDDPVLLTDLHWDILRGKEVSAISDIRFSDRLGVELGQLIADRGYRKVGIDNWFIFPAVHYLALQELAPATTFQPTELIRHVYKHKTPLELDRIRRAEQIGVEALEEVMEAVHVGVDERELALVADYAMRQRGDLEISGGMVVAAGPNTATGSGIPTPGNSYVMQGGDWVMVDICPRWEGYAGDICRMFVAGRLDEVDDFRRNLYEAERTINDQVIAMIKPGVIPRELNESAQSIADDLGVGEYKTTTLGHGVGIDLHDIPDFRWDRWPLEVGDCITIEPYLVVPDVTGVRIEELVAVTESGCEVLSAGSTNELRASDEVRSAA